MLFGKLTLLNKGLFIVAGLLLCCGAFYFIIDSLSKPEVLVLSGQTMGTQYNIQIAETVSKDQLASLPVSIQERLHTLDKEIFSTYIAHSEVSDFNQSAPGQRFNVREELAEVLLISRQVYELTQGAFDITIAPLVFLWGFGPEFNNQDIPDLKDIEQALMNTGIEKISFDEITSTLHKNSELQLDFSAIAKGYAVDEIAKLLENMGIENYLVEIGGELLSRGFKPDGTEWQLAIEQPQAGEQSVQQLIGMNGMRLAIAGSGSYRNYFEYEGAQYSHELDPKTGWPVSHDLVAVTVIHESAALADAYATALMVMGVDDGLIFANEQKIATYFLQKDPTGIMARYNAGFTSFLRH